MSQMQQDPSLSSPASASAARAFLAVPPATLSSLNQLEGLLERLVGVAPRTPSPAAWDRFLSIPADTQNMVVKAWDEQSSFIEAAIRAGLKATDELGMLNFALSRLNLLGDSSLMSEIREGDVIDIFNSEYVQIYRSYSYFALCNYSLVELSAYPWYELYERSMNLTRQLIEVADKVLSGQVSRVSFDHLPEYTLRERLTDAQATFLQKEKFGIRLVSPVTGENFALSVKTVRPIASEAVVAGAQNNLSFI